MPPSEQSSDRPSAGERAGSPTRPTGSWDPVDDEVVPPGGRRPHWSWHGRTSWGRRSVQAYPLVAIVLAVCLVVAATTATRGALDHEVTIQGTATSPAARAPSGTYALVGGAQTTQVLSFDRPSTRLRRIEGSASLALPPYGGWEANGSDAASQALISAHSGRLWVGVTRPTSQYRGWFLTATHPTASSCTFQFWAASPPPVAASAPGATGELVMAVQTSDTIRTGDIDYVFVSEVVAHDGRRSLLAGYASGRVRGAVTHVLKRASWGPGPLHVSIRTNGGRSLSVWVNGTSFFRSSTLHLGVVPPFEPYLEVQALRTSYTVSYTRYAATCGSDITVQGVPDGSVGVLGPLRAVARGGALALPLAEEEGPVQGHLRITLPGGGQTVRFGAHTYWPGDVLTYQPGP